MGHALYSELEQKLQEAASQVEVGALYFHYKDTEKKNPYVVQSLGLLEATEEVCVIYKHPDKEVTWVRALSDWLQNVEWEGKTLPRFTLGQK